MEKIKRKEGEGGGEGSVNDPLGNKENINVIGRRKYKKKKEGREGKRKRVRNEPTYTHTHFELWPKVPGTVHSGTAIERMRQETNHCHILKPKRKIPA